MPDSRFTHTILVIDDEPGIVRLCQRLLERAGFHIWAITEAHQGISILEKEHVDLLLVDIRMPGMDGFQIIEQGRHIRPDLAVVVMTGYGTIDTAVEALRRGVDGLILKPFVGAELVQSVQRALQERQYKQDLSRMQTLRPLFTITESLFAESNPQRLQELLLETVCGLLHCSHAGIYRRQTGDSDLQQVVVRGEALPNGFDLSGSELAGEADLGKSPLRVDRQGAGVEGSEPLLLQDRFGSMMLAPLSTSVAVRDGDTVLLAARSTGEAPFLESDMEMFAILARQAAIALDNAHLQAELRAYIHQVEESQRALMQAEKMAIAGRLTASIAHEINNPLQSVQNCLHLAGRMELPAEERQNYLVMAQSELERLMITVQRMLDYYRPGALDRKPLDLNELLQKVLALMEHQLEEHGVHAQTHFTAHLPFAMGVGDQIQQVFMNLILNAIEAMPEGGYLYIETRARKNRVDVTFEDTGMGVPGNQREHIFEPFVSTKEGGTGLGLAVSYGIIAVHGGSLELIPGRGRGACFRITMPTGEST